MNYPGSYYQNGIIFYKQQPEDQYFLVLGLEQIQRCAEFEAIYNKSVKADNANSANQITESPVASETTLGLQRVTHPDWLPSCLGLTTTLVSINRTTTSILTSTITMTSGSMIDKGHHYFIITGIFMVFSAY